jgi:outer membrane protein insertion porin family
MKFLGMIFFVGLAHLCVAQTFPLEAVSIEADTNFPQAFVLKWSGLKIGQSADNAIFAEACSKLQATGLFRTAAYRYTPGSKNGYVLVLHLEADANLTDAEIDIPNVSDSDVLWTWLHANYPLKGHQVPENDAALSFYSRAIEEYLAANGKRDEVTTRLGGELGPGGKVTVLFQPKNLPKISSIKFEGTRDISAGDLEKRLASMIIDATYTPLQFRHLLEQNVRPLYEERGFLKVAFAVHSENVTEGNVSVTTTVSEGKTYQLAKVSLEGDDIPVEELLKSGNFKIGKLANWTEVLASIGAAEAPLKRDGYIRLAARTERVLHDDLGSVDVVVHMRNGTQFVFGAFRVSGLAPDLEARALGLWNLKKGQPLNLEYSTAYLKAVSVLPEFSKIRTFSTELKINPESNVADVEISFR